MGSTLVKKSRIFTSPVYESIQPAFRLKVYTVSVI